MNKDVENFIDIYDNKIKTMFNNIYEIVMCSTESKVEEKLWARLPSFYVGDNFVRIIPFKDHLNIEASAITAHKAELGGYKLTPKGMLQIYIDQDIPTEVLRKIIVKTLIIKRS